MLIIRIGMILLSTPQCKIWCLIRKFNTPKQIFMWFKIYYVLSVVFFFLNFLGEQASYHKIGNKHFWRVGAHHSKKKLKRFKLICNAVQITVVWINKLKWPNLITFAKTRYIYVVCRVYSCVTGVHVDVHVCK